MTEVASAGNWQINQLQGQQLNRPDFISLQINQQTLSLARNKQICHYSLMTLHYQAFHKTGTWSGIHVCTIL